jgi:hypothetical protein
MRHAEEKHKLTLAQMQEQAKAKQKGEDPRFARQKLQQGDQVHREKVNQLKFQTKAQRDLHDLKVRQMKMKSKPDAKKGKPAPKKKEDEK